MPSEAMLSFVEGMGLRELTESEKRDAGDVSSTVLWLS